MKCSKCGTILNESNQFCPGCGCKIENNTQDMNNQSYNQNVISNQNMNNQGYNQSVISNQNMNQNYNSTNMNYNQNNKNVFGTFSIILGVAAIVLSFLYPIVALIVGIVGIVFASMYVKQTRNKTAGKALSIIGVILGSLGIILKILLVVGITFLTNIFDSLNNNTTVDDKPKDNTVEESKNSTATTLTCSYKGSVVEDTYTIKFDDNGKVSGYIDKVKTAKGLLADCSCPSNNSVTINGINLNDSKYRCNSCPDNSISDDAEVNPSDAFVLLQKLQDLFVIRTLKGTSGFNGNYTKGNTIDYTIEVDFSKLSSDGKKIMGISDETLNTSIDDLDEIKSNYSMMGYTCK